MRFKAISVERIGGLVDQLVELPNEPLLAIAGPNGTGKTKLLAAMVGPWVGNIPANREGETARVAVEVDFSDGDKDALRAFQAEMGWSYAPIPSSAKLIMTRSTIAGTSRVAEPNNPELRNFTSNANFLPSYPALNPMYLPAERRLLPSQGTAIDLSKLAEIEAFTQLQNSRNSVQNYGRLDDDEFEQFAKALCVASVLPSESSGSSVIPISRIQWGEFQETVNELLFPKKLLSLTTAHPDRLRIQLPNGDVHQVPDLSSGERQALVIISRALRAGAGHSAVLIDEPDAYLHPNLSQKLVDALVRGMGEQGQLIFATHSPAILDRIPPTSILRLDHDKPSRLVSDESGLIEMYRGTGFRASALTQSEMLIVTEGDSDEVILKALYPSLARAAIQQGSGRSGVLQRVRYLLNYGLPVLGVVDRDVEPPAILEAGLADRVKVLPTADMEGALLSDDAVLQLMIDHGYAKPEYRDMDRLRGARNTLYLSMESNVVAEMAQNELRKKYGIAWPTPRGENPIDRLRDISSYVDEPTVRDIDEAISAAQSKWEAAKSKPWTVVRGKYILNKFTETCTPFSKGSAFLEVIAKKRPKLAALAEIEAIINDELGGSPGK